MKKIIYLIFLLLVNLNYSQVLSGKIKDSITNELIQYANIVLLNNNVGTNTNNQGYFIIDIKNNFLDTLKVSSIGYKSKYIPLNQFTGEKNINLNILIQEKMYELNEIIIKGENRKYTTKHKLGEKRNGNIGVSPIIGQEYCVLIENPLEGKGILKSILINLKDRHKADFIASLRIKVYSYDDINRLPGNELLVENLIVKPKNNKYSFNVNLENYKILFPENGICLGVEWIDPNNQTKKYDKIGPVLRYTYGGNKSYSWTNYRGRSWKSGTMRYREGKIANPMIGIEVLMQN